MLRCRISTKHFVAHPDWAEYAVYYKEDEWFYLLLDGQGKRMTAWIKNNDFEHSWIDLYPEDRQTHARQKRLYDKKMKQAVDSYPNMSYIT